MTLLIYHKRKPDPILSILSLCTRRRVFATSTDRRCPSSTRLSLPQSPGSGAGPRCKAWTLCGAMILSRVYLYFRAPSLLNPTMKRRRSRGAIRSRVSHLNTPALFILAAILAIRSDHSNPLASIYRRIATPSFRMAARRRPEIGGTPRRSEANIHRRRSPSAARSRSTRSAPCRKGCHPCPFV